MIRTVSLNPPTLNDNTADADRLQAALKNTLQTRRVDIDLGLLETLPETLRESGFRVRCLLLRDQNRWQVIRVQTAGASESPAGLAIDLGTTRVSMRLVDLSDRRPLHEISFENPQTAVGADILTRIHYADRDHGIDELTGMIRRRLNLGLAECCAAVGKSPVDVSLLTVAGNTAMTHFFMGLNPHWMIREPYIPVTNRPGWLPAARLGLTAHPAARVLVFPNIGSYFGGDLIAGILFSGLHRENGISMLVDVGTNAEVVLGNSDWMLACAGAAGPALEGGVTRMGMPAGPGVIDRVGVDPAARSIKLHTIDGLPPRGICGSGLIDLAAGLFLAGMIDTRGKFIPAACGDRLKIIDGLRHLVVATGSDAAAGRDLLLSQADLDSLLRSKAAMFTILETITAQVEVSFNDLEHFFVAGTFGTFIAPRAAITIGMLPDLPLATYQTLGNSSLGGATLALEADRILDEIDRIRERITYLELNVNQEFMNRFSAARFLPHTHRSRFPSVGR